MLDVIQNKNGENICIQTEFPTQGKMEKLVIICHDITSYKKFHVIRKITIPLLKRDYIVGQSSW